jgi:hypothetical protein
MEGRKLLKCVQTVAFKRKESIVCATDCVPMYASALEVSTLFSLSHHLRSLKNFEMLPSFLLYLMTSTFERLSSSSSCKYDLDTPGQVIFLREYVLK